MQLEMIYLQRLDSDPSVTLIEGGEGFKSQLGFGFLEFEKIEKICVSLGQSLV